MKISFFKTNVFQNGSEKMTKKGLSFANVW